MKLPEIFGVSASNTSNDSGRSDREDDDGTTWRVVVGMFAAILFFVVLFGFVFWEWLKFYAPIFK